MPSWRRLSVAVSSELVERAIAEMRKRGANYEYFFERISSPDWITPLRQHGFFDNPPPMEADARGYIRAPSWPPSQFLARVASRAPEEVLKVIMEVHTSNERIHEDLAEVAASMPARLAGRWAEHELGWLHNRERLYFLLPQKLVGVIDTLASGGEVDAALTLTEELFRPVPETSQAEPDERRRATARFSLWEYGQLLHRAAESLLAAAPEATLRLVVRLLVQAIELASFTDAEAGEDYSHVWRPRLADDERDDREPQQALVSALRDAAVAVRERAAVADARLVELLREGRTRVFRRIAALVLARPPLADPVVMADVLVDRESFFDPEPSPEYRELLTVAFDQLHNRSQQVLLGWIAEGPDRNEVRSRRLAVQGSAPTDEDVEHYAALWQIRRLRLIRESLPPKWAQRYDRLVQRFGEVEFITSFEVSTWWGPESPLTVEDLQALSDEELLSLLDRYEGSDQVVGDGVGPSPEGLARTLSALAEHDSERMSRFAPRLAGQRPVYVEWTLRGLGTAASNGKAVMWSSVVDLLDRLAGRWGEDDAAGQDEDDYGRWVWARKEAATILRAAFQSTATPLPFELRQSAWRIVAMLADDPEPTPDYEVRYGGSNMDPATLALNTTRGSAMHSVIAYALWVRRMIEREYGEPAARAEGFDAMPEVRAILERHLDPAYDPSLAVRAVYGQRFPWLVLLDETWATTAAQRIFPEDPVLRDMWDAAWTSYILFCQPYAGTLNILRSQYSHAIDRLGDQRPPWRWLGAETPEDHLAAHLLTFYWRGALDLGAPDGLLERFFAAAPPDTRASAIKFLGRDLRDRQTLDDGVRDRLQRFWHWRLQEAERDEHDDQSTEIAAFAWWADAEVLPADWRLAQLERVLRLGGSLKPDSVALAALAKLAPLAPVRAIRVLASYLDREKKGWTITAGRESIKGILRTCLDSQDSESRRPAEDLVHWLGSLGYREFRSLLPGDRS
jgi:hypothetical protein